MDLEQATNAVLGLVDPANAWSHLWASQASAFDSQAEFQQHLRNAITFDEYIDIISRLDDENRVKLIGTAVREGASEIKSGSYRQKSLRSVTGEQEVQKLLKALQPRGAKLGFRKVWDTIQRRLDARSNQTGESKSEKHHKSTQPSAQVDAEQKNTEPATPSNRNSKERSKKRKSAGKENALGLTHDENSSLVQGKGNSHGTASIPSNATSKNKQKSDVKKQAEEQNSGKSKHSDKTETKDAARNHDDAVSQSAANSEKSPHLPANEAEKQSTKSSRSCRRRRNTKGREGPSATPLVSEHAADSPQSAKKPGDASSRSTSDPSSAGLIATNISSGGRKRKRKSLLNPSESPDDTRLAKRRATQPTEAPEVNVSDPSPEVGMVDNPSHPSRADIAPATPSMQSTQGKAADRRLRAPPASTDSGTERVPPVVTRTDTASPDAEEDHESSSSVSTDTEFDESNEEKSPSEALPEPSGSSSNGTRQDNVAQSATALAAAPNLETSPIKKQPEPSEPDPVALAEAQETPAEAVKAHPREAARATGSFHHGAGTSVDPSDKPAVNTIPSARKVHSSKNATSTPQSIARPATLASNELRPTVSGSVPNKTPETKTEQHPAPPPRVVNSVPRARGPSETMAAIKRLEKFTKHGDENYPSSDEEDTESSSSDESDDDVGEKSPLRPSAEHLSENTSDETASDQRAGGTARAQGESISTEESTGAAAAKETVDPVPAGSADKPTADAEYIPSTDDSDSESGPDLDAFGKPRQTLHPGVQEHATPGVEQVTTGHTYGGPHSVGSTTVRSANAGAEPQQPEESHNKDSAHVGESISPASEKKGRRTFEKVSKYFPSPEKPEKPKRVPAGTSAVPFPSIDAPRFGVMQEKLADDPFRLLLATIFLNKTAGRFAIPVMNELLESYPTPELLAQADLATVGRIIEHLGLVNQRARKVIGLAQKWVGAPPVKGKRYRTLHYPMRDDGKNHRPAEILEGDSEACAGFLEIGHLPGCGPYAWDSWRISCRDALRGVDLTEHEPEWKRVIPGDKELRAYLRWLWLREGWIWDPLTGDKVRATEPQMAIARAGISVLPVNDEVEAETSAALEAADEPHSNPDGSQPSGLTSEPKEKRKPLVAKRTMPEAESSSDGDNATPEKTTAANNIRHKSSRKKNLETVDAPDEHQGSSQPKSSGLQFQMSPSVRKRMRIKDSEPDGAVGKRRKTGTAKKDPVSQPSHSRANTKLSATQQRDTHAMKEARSQKNRPTVAARQASNAEEPILISDNEAAPVTHVRNDATPRPTVSKSSANPLSTPKTSKQNAGASTTKTAPSEQMRFKPGDTSNDSLNNDSPSSLDSPPLPPSSIRRSSSRPDVVEDSEPDGPSAHTRAKDDGPRADESSSEYSSSVETTMGGRETSREL